MSLKDNPNPFLPFRTPPAEGRAPENATKTAYLDEIRAKLAQRVEALREAAENAAETT